MATANALHYIRFGLCCPPAGLVAIVPVSILRLVLVVVVPVSILRPVLVVVVPASIHRLVLVVIVPAAILLFALVVTVPSIIIHRLVFVWRQPPYFWLLRQPP